MQAWLQGMGFAAAGVVGNGLAGKYDQIFTCYGAVFLQNGSQEKATEIDNGGKILLPSSSLDLLLRLNIQYPMLFKVSNLDIQRMTHAGVLEFSAPEGQAIVPHWMMLQLGLNDGDQIRVESATLASATFAKLKPMSLEFLNITNPKAVLEVALRKYACLTKGDRIPTSYVGQTVEFMVVDLKPANAVCIIECDLNLDFDAPEGYVEQPKAAATAVNVKPPAPPASAFAGAGQALGSGGSPGSSSSGTPSVSAPAFAGASRRLDGKKNDSVSICSEESVPEASTSDLAAIVDDLPAVPPILINEDYKPGKISFVRYDYKRRDVLEREQREKEAASGTQASSSKAFRGVAKTLRGSK